MKFVKNVVGLFGSAVHEGQTRTGTELAPKKLREGGLLSAVYNLGWQVHDRGDILGRKFVQQGQSQEFFKNSQLIGLINEQIEKQSHEIAKDNQFLLNIGGDHGVSSGSIHGLLRHYQDDLRIVWVDAHADCNYELNKNRNYHGMPLGHLFGAVDQKVLGFEWLTKKLNTKNLIYVGLRDVDSVERQFIKDHGIKYFSMDEIIENGIGDAMKFIVKEFEGKPIHVSFDIDSIDPENAHATGTLVDGGLTYREAHYLLRKLATTKQLIGMDLTEINPLLEKTPEPREEFFGDFQQIGKIQGTQTVALGIELVASALGRSLL
ncbi:hypothetical protein pb186bvf_021080 [Paramecium bursaria]